MSLVIRNEIEKYLQIFQQGQSSERVLVYLRYVVAGHIPEKGNHSLNLNTFRRFRYGARIRIPVRLINFKLFGDNVYRSEMEIQLPSPPYPS